MKTRTSSSEPAGAARRVPSQERAKKRVERILDAAAHVFAEQGYEAATMEAIADRAETSIGSIYQFFPNKLALFDALARHYHGKLRVFADLLLGGPMLEQPWTELLDSCVDAFMAFHESEPGFRAVWAGLHLTADMVTEGEAINRELTKRLEAILAAKLPAIPDRQRPVVAQLMVEILSAMLIVGARRPTEAKALMSETKVLLRRYLAPYEEEENTPRRKGSERERRAVRSTR